MYNKMQYETVQQCTVRCNIIKNRKEKEKNSSYYHTCRGWRKNTHNIELGANSNNSLSINGRINELYHTRSAIEHLTV